MKDKNQKVEKEKVAPKAIEKIIDDGVSKEEMSPEQYVEYLETTIGKTFAEAQDCKNQAQRIQAEFENYRKRNESFGQEMRQLGIAAVVEKMIEVLDNCDRARVYIKDENSLMGFNIMVHQITSNRQRLMDIQSRNLFKNPITLYQTKEMMFDNLGGN